MSLDELKIQLERQEQVQTQIQQRQDIFEDQIIKRVREIQKYSKGLNILIRKNVMTDIQKLKETTIDADTPDAAAESVSAMKTNNDDILNIISNFKEQLANQSQEMYALADKVDNQDQMVENMQINIDTDISTKYGLHEEKLQQMQQQLNEFAETALAN